MYQLLIGLLWPLLLTSVVTVVAKQTREVSSPVVNPNCTLGSDCNNPWIVDTTAVGENDTLHNLWGAVGAPTFMMAITNSSAELKISWDNFKKFEEGSVAFEDSSDVGYVFGFTITQMILFNDVNDTGNIENIPENQRHEIPMLDFTWQIKEVVNSSIHEKGVVFETDTFQGNSLPNDTKISIKVLAFGEDGRSADLPHLITTPDSAQFDIILDHLVLNISDSYLRKEDAAVPIGNFSSPRWAMELVIFSMEDRSEIQEGFVYTTHKSLDDENTPGVFNIDEITTNRSRSGGKGGYMQWRPVSYLTDKRDINYSTYPNVNTSFAEIVKLKSINESLAFAVFGDQLANHMVTTRTVVAFGHSKDKFYTANNYTTWTLSYGVGSPPTETFSSLVTMIISLGVGIPVFVFLLVGIFICYRNFRG